MTLTVAPCGCWLKWNGWTWKSFVPCSEGAKLHRQFIAPNATDEDREAWWDHAKQAVESVYPPCISCRHRQVQGEGMTHWYGCQHGHEGCEHWEGLQWKSKRSKLYWWWERVRFDCRSVFFYLLTGWCGNACRYSKHFHCFVPEADCPIHDCSTWWCKLIRRIRPREIAEFMERKENENG